MMLCYIYLYYQVFLNPVTLTPTLGVACPVSKQFQIEFTI